MLGIASVTLNVILNDFLRTNPAPGRVPYTYAGRTWYIDENRIAHYDRQMQTEAKHEWMVSTIVLLTPLRNNPRESWIGEAAHPEADPGGIFVMLILPAEMA